MFRKTIIFLTVLLLLVSCSGCEETERTGFTIAQWNVQNLFDGNSDGTEYTEYTRQAGWSSKLYRARLENIESVLSYPGLAEAEIIVLNEVENSNVTQDIMHLDALQKRGFLWQACASEEGGAISVALISSIPIQDVRLHSVQGARPVIEARFEICGKNVYVLALHGKSNLGDEEEVTALRQRTGEALANRAQYLRENDPLCLIVIAGDFNEDPHSGNIIQDMGLWHSFWDDLSFDGKGSYLYDGNWQRYDNILLSSDLITQAAVVQTGILTDTDGSPNRWRRELLSGVSDHLPVWVQVRLL